MVFCDEDLRFAAGVYWHRPCRPPPRVPLPRSDRGEAGGETEVRVENGRVDVVAGEFAIEVERAVSWKQAIGQSFWCALQTNKKAGIVLVVEDEKRERGHVIRLGSVIEAHQLPIKVWLRPDDFR